MSFLGDTWNSLAAAGTGAMEWIGNLWNSITGFISSEFERFMANPAEFIGEVIGKYLRFFYYELPIMLGEAFMFLVTAIGDVIQKLPGIIGGILESIGGAISDFIGSIKGVIDGFGATLDGLPATLETGLAQATTAIVNWVKGLGTAVKDSIGNFGKGLWNGLTGNRGGGTGTPEYGGSGTSKI